MTRQARHSESNQRRSATSPDVFDSFAKETRGLLWLGSVAVTNEEILEGRQVFGDIASRGL
jgi:hypothetical protein